MGEKIIDRDIECDKICNLFNSDKYNVFFVYSKTGVGKSFLTKELSYRFSANKTCINIINTQKNNSSKDNEGEFISSIFNTFVRYMYNNKADLKKRTFEYFLKKNKSIKKKSIEKLMSSIDYNSIKRTTFLNIVKHFVNKIFKTFEYNEEGYFNLNDKDTLIIAYNYIIYVLNFGDVFWSIDNFQNIDSYSKQLLREIISLQPKTNITIIEYTIVNDSDYTELIEINSNYKLIGINSTLFELPNMDSSEINEILDTIKVNIAHEYIFFYDAKQYYLNESDGNLFKLIEYKITYNTKHDYSDPIIKKINSLTPDQKYILYLIALSGGKISKIQLDNIINRSKNIVIVCYNEQYSKLINDVHLLQESQGFVNFTHASILDTINKYNDLKNPQVLLAYRNLTEYHSIKMTSDIIDINHKFESINLILNLTYRYNPKEIIQYLKITIPYLYEKISPVSLMKYIFRYIEFIKNDFDNKLDELYFIMRFCFNYYLYQECLQIINIIKSKSSNYSIYLLNVYEINALEYLENHNMVIQKCENLIKQDISDKEKYIYYLLLIGSYRSINLKDKSIFYAHEIQKIKDYQSYNEYGIYLRLTETYMEREEALPYLKKSIKHFIKTNDVFNEIKSRITYSFLLAVTQDIQSAKDELEIAKNKSKENNFLNFSIVFLLNQSALDILNNEYGLSVESNLQQAEISTNSPYDKLLIVTLRLINAVESKYKSIIPSLILKINEYIQYESDKHLLALVMYNLFLYYSILNDEKNKNKYLEFAQQYAHYNTTVRYKLVGKINSKQSALFNIKWVVGFTFFWNVDI
ncbi:hypothetical protein [Massilimicrobiota sp. An134]|uniref:hypothetical protein n=1 Tax=Massilimicrobiota sp. An134 TaxID=1965557 RepID=UPI000B36A82E|nr:hypothetical protein [Massilimicrobiota sp. An134]OUQ23242.1 hypothetical protein B5E79_12960 [Massilimicrobiota sp. An134]